MPSIMFDNLCNCYISVDAYLFSSAKMFTVNRVLIFFTSTHRFRSLLSYEPTISPTAKTYNQVYNPQYHKFKIINNPGFLTDATLEIASKVLTHKPKETCGRTEEQFRSTPPNQPTVSVIKFHSYFTSCKSSDFMSDGRTISSTPCARGKSWISIVTWVLLS